MFFSTMGSVVRAQDPTDGLTVSTLNGENITIKFDPPRVNDNSNILIDDGLMDIEADNGIIHDIDSVLTPASVSSNIVDIAVGNNMSSTLVAAVKAARLVDALSGEGPLTVFAPTNSAFAALLEGTLESLLQPENVEQLTNILTYHVVAANADSSSLSYGDTETLNGDLVEVSISDEGVSVNDANVVTADIIASNGIIHVIDKVLLPPADTAPATTEALVEAPESNSIYDIAASTTDLSTLAMAVDLAGLAKTLSSDGTFTIFALPNSAFDKLPKEVVAKLLDPTWQPQLQDLGFTLNRSY